MESANLRQGPSIPDFLLWWFIFHHTGSAVAINFQELICQLDKMSDQFVKLLGFWEQVCRIVIMPMSRLSQFSFEASQPNPADKKITRKYKIKKIISNKSV